MHVPRGTPSWLTVLAAVISLLSTVEGSNDLVERQNPSFITVLPTSATEPVVVVTTTSISTVDIPPVVQPTPVIPPTSSLQIATPIPTANSSPSSSISTLSTPLATPPANSATDTPQSDQGSLSVDEDSFFGRVPTLDPDAAVLSIFLAIFVFFAVVHGFYYRWNHGRSKRVSAAALSKLVALFCLARVAACLLRLAWIAAGTSAVVVFIAVITDNAGTILLIVVNYHLTKQMISFCQLRYSLWARTVIKKAVNVTLGIVFAAIFLLNTLGVALFEVQVTSGRDPTTEAQLVQASEGLLIAVSLIFNFSVLTTMLTSPWAPVDRLTVKIVIYVLGPGLLTLFSQLMRLIAAFMIWEPFTPLSSELLSKPAYYINGFGIEVLILILYGFWETNLLRLMREAFLPHHTDTIDRPAARTPKARPRPQSSESTMNILPLSLPPKTEGGDGALNNLDDERKRSLRSTVICSTPLGTGDEDDGDLGCPPKPWAITVHRSFTMSSNRDSIIGKAI